MYVEQLVTKFEFPALVSDLNSSEIDITKSMNRLELLAEPSIGCVINHLTRYRYFWILPQRKALSPWAVFSPNSHNLFPLLTILILVVLILIWWMIARADLVEQYKHLTDAMFSVIRLSLSNSLPTIPKSRKLRAFLFFILLVFIPTTVNVQSVWTSTLTNPIREAEINDLQKLARSDLPMKFSRSLIDTFASILDEASARAVKEKWQDPHKEDSEPDVFGRRGAAILATDIALHQIKNILDVEMFEQVSNKLQKRKIEVIRRFVGITRFIACTASDEIRTPI